MIKRLLLLGVVALMVGAGARLITASTPAAAVSTPQAPPGFAAPASGAKPFLPFGDSSPRWQVLWTRPTPNLQSLALASNGAAVAWVDSKGSVRHLEGVDGATLWQTPPFPNVSRVQVAPSGCVLAYTALNPLHPVVRVLDARAGAKKTIEYVLDGAIWEAQIMPDGERALVGTGKSALYLVPLPSPIPQTVKPAGAAPPAKPEPKKVPPSKATPSLVRLSTQGIPESLAAATTATDSMILMGTWQNTGVSAWGEDGFPRWQRSDGGEADRIYEVQVSADGSTAAAISTRGPKRLGAEADTRLFFWDAHTGRLLCGVVLEGTAPKLRLSANGRVAAVTYNRVIAAGSQAAPDRRLALFDRDGRRLFGDKGGLYFTPELVAISADGGRITVRDTAHYLWTLDNRGHMISRQRLPLDAGKTDAPTIRDTIATDDGKYLLVRRGDDKITLFKAVVP